MIPGSRHSLFGLRLPPVTWSTTDKSSNITVSGGDLIATSTDANLGSIRGTRTISGGVISFTVTVAGLGGTSGEMYIGLADATQPLTQQIGRNTSGNGWSWVNQTSGAATIWHNNTSSGYTSTYTNGDVIKIEWDVGAQTLRFYKNAADQGVAFTGVSGSLYPAMTIFKSGASGTANFTGL